MTCMSVCPQNNNADWWVNIQRDVTTTYRARLQDDWSVDLMADRVSLQDLIVLLGGRKVFVYYLGVKAVVVGGATGCGCRF